MHNFREACNEFKYLRERGYPEKASLKLVGDRHALSRVQRNCMFRGIIVDHRAEQRKKKIAAPAGIAGACLGVDWYNVLITVESYRRGVVLFVSDDGIVRDSAATHGSYRRTALTERALGEIVAAIAALAPLRVDAFLDAPIAFSALMADDVRARFSAASCAAGVALAHSADFPLKGYEGTVASSDSVVLDSARRIFDLPRFVLERSYGFTPPLLLDLFPPAPEERGR